MAKICMNEACHTTTTFEWKKGWGLKSGGFATLCYSCGSAFENLVYCERFHLEESGWRECRICAKRIHCGCIASKNLHDYLDFGGVGCISCAKSLEAHSVRSNQIPSDNTANGFVSLGTNNANGPQSSVIENKLDGISLDRGKPMLMSKPMEVTQKSDTDSSIGQTKREDIKLPIGQTDAGFTNLIQQSIGSSVFTKPENSNSTPKHAVNDMFESLGQPSLTFSLGTPLRTPNPVLPFSSGAIERKEKAKFPPFQQGQRARHILPKMPKTSLGLGSHTRIARPPAEGRGRNQLLPRYWPRITDKELQKISGDLNSTIVPLFEKVLSASDAGRIGRLVLPKACAEAYFPPISQSEGLPLKVQDIKGKEWTFQFRFWPNNNSRMYVLEGVTPCIQNMQLQAGDTVIFSRIDPGGKLVMGFRKATNHVDMQDGQSSVSTNGALSGETSFSGVDEQVPANGGKKNEDLFQRPILKLEKKRTRNIGLKSKRLLMHSEDARELSLTWAEAQELLRPHPTDKPNIVMIEDYEIEEFDEAPVIGKKTIFTARPSGEQEQWAQCDSCLKWRKLPLNILLPPKWTCSENIWDLSRCSCSAPDEMSPKELESLIGVGKDTKKRKSNENQKVAKDHEQSGLDALATAAVLGDSLVDSGEPSAGTTTRHPRHRPGCTCIVCIQPPSGKFKHKPTCVCNVCMTVKRRFKTLMLRKKRQSEGVEVTQGKDPNTPRAESEMDGTSVNVLPNMHLSTLMLRKKRQSEKAEIPRENDQTPIDESEMEGTSVNTLPNGRVNNPSENGMSREGGIEIEVGETSKGKLDLNCHPNHEEDLLRLTMESLLNAARDCGHSIFRPCLVSEAAGESKKRLPDEAVIASSVGEDESKGDED